MKKFASSQNALFPDHMGVFPSTRYQGSKAKIVDWIWSELAPLKFKTCLDAFGGTGAIAFRMKQAGKQVTYNDLLRFNYYFGLALIENNKKRLTPDEVEWILTRHPSIQYPTFIQDTFKETYFTEEENRWLDQTITNIRGLKDPYKFALAFFALCQSCIIKRPYNLFHRKNLYIRLADVNRTFGNKATWDKPFEEFFLNFVDEANNAVFDNGKSNKTINVDALEAPSAYDLVYIDTPYISGKGVGTDYLDFYHFLEGLTDYDRWAERIDHKSKHKRLKLVSNAWSDSQLIKAEFQKLFQRFAKSILVVSYRSDGIPSEQELIAMLGKHKSHVQSRHFGKYKYVLSKNGESKEILLIGT